MKVLLFNGSPNKNGAVSRALSEVESVLNGKGIETMRLDIGKAAVRGCNDCGKCRGKNLCVYNDIANDVIEAMETCDGMVIGAPVYYAGINGSVKSVLDRVFFAGGYTFKYKVGAAVVNARRAGTTTSYEEINKYFAISGMIISPSCYWNMTHGNSAEEAEQDIEGMGIMRVIGNSMAWLLKVLEDGKKKYGIPKKVPVDKFNFIH